MKFNARLIERCARSVPGEQTELLGIGDIAQEDGYSVHKALSEHPTGIPVSAYRDEDGELCILQRDGLSHVLVAGSTGCGKSMRYLINQLFDLNGKTSVIVADIKGELYRYTARYLKSVYGEENVHYMDFIRPERSEVLFNPFTGIAQRYLEAELYPDRVRSIRNEALADLRKLCDKLFPNRSEKDPSWDEGARGFIYGILVGLLEDMFLNREQEAKTGRRRVLPEQINFETVNEVFSRFEYGEEFNDRGFFETRDRDDLALRHVRGIINDARNTRACYLQLVESYLNGYSYPDICALTIADTFDIASLADTPQVLFLTYDITDERMRGFVNQYVVKSLDTLKEKAIDRGAPLEVPVMYLLDEFPTLQADPIYATLFSVGRGWNIFITAIVQDLTQLETTYSNGVAQQIRNNCNLMFFLGTNDVHTAKAVKEQLGRHIIPDPASYLQGAVKFIEVNLVAEDALMHRMEPGETYITINSHMPMRGYFELYFNCPEYTRYPQDSGEKHPAIDVEDAKYHYDTSWMQQRRKNSLWE